MEGQQKEQMKIKLYDSELNIMEYLWRVQEASAKEIAAEMAAQVGWSKTTTYTVLKKCVDKGAVERREPGFHCKPLISREQVQEYETRELIDKLYGGSADRLVASLLGGQTLSGQEIDNLKRLIDRLEQG